MHWDLLRQARELALRDPRKPRQVNLRRAVSSAYYALFHALIDEACRIALGAGHEQASYRHVLGRAFTHATMKQACAAFAGGTLRAAVARGLPRSFSIPQEIRTLAELFLHLQEQRSLADYDRTARFIRTAVLGLVGRAETDLRAFDTLVQSVEKKFFLVCLLTWTTLAGR